MTTSVLVKARAHGAKISVTKADGSSKTIEVEANQDQSVHIDEGDSVTVQQGDAPVPEVEQEPALRTGLDPKNVPGRAENDKFLGKAPADTTKVEG